MNTESLLLAVVLLAGPSTGQILGPLLGIDRLANGNTLITDGGMPDFARLVEVDSSGQIVWAYLKNDIRFAHTARRLPNGNTLITATSESRVMEVDPAGELVWSMSIGLLYPNEAGGWPTAIP